jgi:hypothetical protein
MKQIRVPIGDLDATLAAKLGGEVFNTNLIQGAD